MAELESVPESAVTPDSTEGTSSTLTASPPGQPSQEPKPSSEQPAGSQESSEQPFIENFDPKSVAGTPLEVAYKQMQSAFTRKTQDLAERTRSLEGSHSDAEKYRAIMGNEQVRSLIFDALQGKQTKSAPPPEPVEDLSAVDISSLTDNELMDYLQKRNRQEAESIVQERMSQITPLIQAQTRIAYASSLNTAKNQVTAKYPNFGDYDKPIARELAKTNPQTGNAYAYDLYLQSNGSDDSPLQRAMEAMYKNLAFDGLSSQAAKKANEIVHAKVEANLPSSVSTVKTAEIQNNNGKSLSEIAESSWERNKARLGIQKFDMGNF